MEYRRERRQRIRTRRHHFPHHVHLDGTDISQCHLDVIARIRINLSKFLLQQLACILNRHVVQVHRTQVDDVHIAVGRNLQPHGILASAPHVDNHLVTRSQAVVFRRSHAQVRLESQLFNVEDIPSEHIVLAGNHRRQVAAFLHGLLHIFRPHTLVHVCRTCLQEFRSILFRTGRSSFPGP